MKQINRTKQESHQLSVTTLPNIDNTIGSDTETALDQNLCSTSQYWVRKTGACSYSCENVSMKFLDLGLAEKGLTGEKEKSAYPKNVQSSFHSVGTRRFSSSNQFCTT